MLYNVDMCFLLRAHCSNEFYDIHYYYYVPTLIIFTFSQLLQLYY